MSEPFIAEVRMFPYNFAPRGWAYCDGSLLEIRQNTALFALLGTIYGGDGRVNFGLPNLQGKVPMGPGRGPGLATYKLGQSTGEAISTLNETNIPSHTHTAMAEAGKGQDPNPAGLFPGKIKGVQPYRNNPSSTTVPLSSQYAGKSGNSQPHENMQPYVVIPYCIALDGTFPSRS